MKIVIFALLLVLSVVAEEQKEQESDMANYGRCRFHFDCISYCCLGQRCHPSRDCKIINVRDANAPDSSSSEGSSSLGFVYWGLLGIVSVALIVALGLLWHYHRKLVCLETSPTVSTHPLRELRDQLT